MTIVIQDAIPEEVIFYIAPERWTMTFMTIVTLSGVANIILVAAAIYYTHKYFSCCSGLRQDYQESKGCKRKVKFFFQHVLPSFLHVANTASDFWYLLVIPTFDVRIFYIQLASLFLP